MEPFEDDKLVAALEALRPAPRPAFAAELDERAAAGFPRRARAGGSLITRLAARLRAVQPRRALIPAGATALAAVAAVTVVVAIGESNGGPSEAHFGQAAGARADGSVQYEADVPLSLGRPRGRASSAASAASAAAAPADLSDLSGKVRPFSRDTGPYASLTSHREIERSAQLVLGSNPAEVGKAASKVFETVHAYRGIVLRSSIRNGEAGVAGARFELLIPSARLGDALAAFSDIAEVRSRHEATADITAPTVRTGELLRDSRAKIEGLLSQLAQADTDAERTATEAKLRAERRHSAHLRSQLSSLQRRANLSRVSLRIETGAASTSPSETGGWGVDDALDDAGHILGIAAGVTVVGLAILGPVALIALLAWLANRANIRRGRRRALE